MWNATLIRNIIEDYNNIFIVFFLIEDFIVLHNNPFTCEILNEMKEIIQKLISFSLDITLSISSDFNF